MDALKYRVIYNAMIPASGFCHRRSKSLAGKFICGILPVPPCLLPFMVNAGTVGNDVSYLTSRGFAENKRMFVAGATNIAIYNKDSTIKGYSDKTPCLISPPLIAPGLPALFIRNILSA